MKNVRDIVEKPSTNDFFVGFRIKDNIEGILNIRLESAQRITRVDLLICFYHCIMVSVMHQKLPTFN